MKLVTFEREGKRYIGVQVSQKVMDIAAAARTYAKGMTESQVSAYAAAVAGDMVSFLRTGEEGMAFVRILMDLALMNELHDTHTNVWHTLEQIQVRAPILHPGKIICVGKNYQDHAAEMNSAAPTTPIIFAKFSNVISDPHGKVVKPLQSDQLDYEAELAVIIGKTAKNIKREDVFEYIAGYSCFNDLSVRDYQMRTSQWLQGKTFDQSGPFGPVLVTKEEVDPLQLDIRCYVNGEVRQNANTSNMIFDIPYLLEFISGIMTLEAGDVIATGTPSGVAAGMENPKFLHIGDEVVVEIEGIGELHTYIIEA